MEGMIPALFLKKPLIRDMFEGKTLLLCEKERRFYGVHFTPLQVFESFILSEIRDKVYDYIWVDLFAGAVKLTLRITGFTVSVIFCVVLEFPALSVTLTGKLTSLAAIVAFVVYCHAPAPVL